jgi:tape measure domain-containing protein
MTRKFLEEKGLSKEVIDAILDENSKDIGKAKGELDSVKAELETANKDKEGLQQQINDTIVDKMTGTMQGIINSVQKTIDILDEVDSATSKGFDTSKIDSARRIIDEVNAEYQETQEQIKKAANNQETLNQKLSTGKTSASSFVKAIAGLSVVQKVLSLVTGQLDSAISRMDTMTNFNRTMTAVTGSADLASASLSELKTITKGTAYGLDTAASAVQNFTTRGMSIGNATSEVGKWADAVAFYGDGTNETLETVQDALGKMMSKGTVEMEQLNRLTDAGINAVGIYAQATGKSTASVQDDLSSGKISAMDFITTTSTAFEEGTNGVLSIAGAAKEAGGTWATSLSNMKAAVTRGLISVIDSINEGLTNAGFWNNS